MKKYYLSDFMYSVRAFFSSGCWIRNRRTCRKWDNKLRELLKNPVFTDYNTYTVKINGVEIWVENYPYCYGYVYEYSLQLRFRLRL